ncbi:MAG: hypothetical protein CL563_08010 [Alphaproteobacteria bacterium]|nr:hypothetical protein [Alphaproteobacteria bacterium]
MRLGFDEIGFSTHLSRAALSPTPVQLSASKTNIDRKRDRGCAVSAYLYVPFGKNFRCDIVGPPSASDLSLLINVGITGTVGICLITKA